MNANVFLTCIGHNLSTLSHSALSVLSIALIMGVTHADTKTPSSSPVDWNNVASWVAPGVPNPGDTANLTGTGTITATTDITASGVTIQATTAGTDYTVAGSANVSVGAITVSSGAQLGITAAGTLTVSGSSTVGGAGSALELAGAAVAFGGVSVTSGGTFTADATTITGNDLSNVVGSSVALRGTGGASSATFTGTVGIDGDLTLEGITLDLSGAVDSFMGFGAAPATVRVVGSAKMKGMISGGVVGYEVGSGATFTQEGDTAISVFGDTTYEGDDETSGFVLAQDMNVDDAIELRFSEEVDADIESDVKFFTSGAEFSMDGTDDANRVSVNIASGGGIVTNGVVAIRVQMDDADLGVGGTLNVRTQSNALNLTDSTLTASGTGSIQVTGNTSSTTDSLNNVVLSVAPTASANFSNLRVSVGASGGTGFVIAREGASGTATATFSNSVFSAPGVDAGAITISNGVNTVWNAVTVNDLALNISAGGTLRASSNSAITSAITNFNNATVTVALGGAVFAETLPGTSFVNFNVAGGSIDLNGILTIARASGASSSVFARFDNGAAITSSSGTGVISIGTGGNLELGSGSTGVSLQGVTINNSNNLSTSTTAAISWDDVTINTPTRFVSITAPTTVASGGLTVNFGATDVQFTRSVTGTGPVTLDGAGVPDPNRSVVFSSQVAGPAVTWQVSDLNLSDLEFYAIGNTTLTNPVAGTMNVTLDNSRLSVGSSTIGSGRTLTVDGVQVTGEDSHLVVFGATGAAAGTAGTLLMTNGASLVLTRSVVSPGDVAVESTVNRNGLLRVEDGSSLTLAGHLVSFSGDIEIVDSTVTLTDSADLAMLQSTTDLAANPALTLSASTLSIDGNFVSEINDASDWNIDASSVISMTGAGTIEAMDQDLGIGGFASAIYIIPTLEILGSYTVVDAFDNALGAGGEAIYVDHLILGPGAVFNYGGVGGFNVYFNSLSSFAVPEPSAWMLMVLGLLFIKNRYRVLRSH